MPTKRSPRGLKRKIKEEKENLDVDIKNEVSLGQKYMFHLGVVIFGDRIYIKLCVHSILSYVRNG